jgi:hypothetical protein
MKQNTDAADTHDLPKVSAEGYKLLAENLQRGDVVDLAYSSGGKTCDETVVVAKSNKGGIRLVRPDATTYPLVIINCYGGTVYEKKGNGATDYKRQLGERGRVVRTGETANVGTKRGGRIYTTDYSDE